MSKKLTREYVAKQATETGIDDDGITRIMNTHNAIVENLKEDLETANAELTRVSAELDEAKKPSPELDTLKGELKAEKVAHAKTKSDLKANLEAEKVAHAATKTAYDEEKTDAAIDKTVVDALEAAGYATSREARDTLETFMRSDRYNRNDLKRDENGAITNLEEYVEAISTIPSLRTYVGKMEEKSTDVGKSPHGQTVTPKGGMNSWIRQSVGKEETINSANTQ